MKMPHPAMAFNTIFCGFHMIKPHSLVDKSGKWRINKGFTGDVRQSRKAG
jgi:hypothetical protein